MRITITYMLSPHNPLQPPTQPPTHHTNPTPAHILHGENYPKMSFWRTVFFCKLHKLGYFDQNWHNSWNLILPFTNMTTVAMATVKYSVISVASSTILTTWAAKTKRTTVNNHIMYDMCVVIIVYYCVNYCVINFDSCTTHGVGMYGVNIRLTTATRDRCSEKYGVRNWTFETCNKSSRNLTVFNSLPSLYSSFFFYIAY